MHRLRAFALLWAALLMVATTGCGYRLLSADADGRQAPIRIRSVEDRSREPLFGAQLRARLAEVGLERGDVSIETRGELYELDVKLRSLNEEARAYVAGDLPREYLLVVTADATLYDPHDKLIWKNTEITARREFPAGADVDTAQRNKDRALVILAEDLAGEILRRTSLAVEELDTAGGSE